MWPLISTCSSIGVGNDSVVESRVEAYIGAQAGSTPTGQSTTITVLAGHSVVVSATSTNSAETDAQNTGDGLVACSSLNVAAVANGATDAYTSGKVTINNAAETDACGEDGSLVLRAIRQQWINLIGGPGAGIARARDENNEECVDIVRVRRADRPRTDCKSAPA